MPRSFLSVSIIVLCEFALGAFSLAEAPQLREVLSSEEYAKRRNQALQIIGDWKVLEESRAPVIGVSIVRRTSGMWADQMGLRNGDVLVAVDQEVIWGGGTKLNGAQLQQLQLYLPRTNELRTEFVQTEKLGVGFEHYWRPELAFLRGTQRSEAFDSDCLVAATMRGRDPDLAETALKRALQAGYQFDGLSHQIALEIALLQNRPEVALQFADILAEQFEKDTTIHPVLILRAALANGKFALAKRVLDFQDRMSGQKVDINAYAIVEEWARRVHLAESGRDAALKDEAQRMLPIDLSSTMQGSSYHSIHTNLSPLLRGEKLTLQAEADEIKQLLYQPPAPVLSFDTSLSMEFSSIPDDVPDSTFSWVLYSILSLQIPEDLCRSELQITPIAQIHFSNTWTVGIRFANMLTDVEIFDSSLAAAPGEKKQLRVQRIGTTIAVYLNGNRILLAPAADTIVPVRMKTQVSGTRVELSDLVFQELVQRAPE